MSESSGGASEITGPGALSNLSPRELEIARLYAAGRTSREIADELHISPTTVRNHVATIYRKLEIGNKTHLIKLIGSGAQANFETGNGALGDPVIVRGPSSLGIESALEAARSQQRAINEILRVICHSPGDLEAILDAALDHALRLSHSHLGIVYLYNDGSFTAPVLKNVPAAFEAYLRAGPLSPGAGTGLGRMTKQHRIIHIHDIRAEAAYQQGDPLRRATVDLGGARTFIAIPMIHRDRLIGAFAIYRQEVRPFNDSELELLQVFSDQAAIALTITRLLDGK
jgi:DNA-binding CsgD family transcriptional regulator